MTHYNGTQNYVEISKILLIFTVLSSLSMMRMLSKVSVQSTQSTFKPPPDCKRWSTQMMPTQHEFQIIEQQSKQSENEPNRGVTLSGGAKFLIMQPEVLFSPLSSIRNKIQHTFLVSWCKYGYHGTVHLWPYSPFVGPWPLFQFLNPIHSR
jgi:hypothetical protein